MKNLLAILFIFGASFSMNASDITSIDLPKEIARALPGYIFVSGDHKMREFPSSGGAIPNNGFLYFQAHCLLQKSDTTDKKLPREISDCIQRSVRNTHKLMEISYGEEGSETPQLDISPVQFGQFGCKAYTKHHDGTGSRTVFLVQTTSLPLGQILVTIEYTKASLPINHTEPNITRIDEH